MKAIVRRYTGQEWVAVVVETNPLTTSIGDKEQEKGWIDDLPPALVGGKSTTIRENPEGWIISISGMPYSRFSVEIVEP